jgi:hypothetical protein
MSHRLPSRRPELYLGGLRAVRTSHGVGRIKVICACGLLPFRAPWTSYYGGPMRALSAEVSHRDDDRSRHAAGLSSRSAFGGTRSESDPGLAVARRCKANSVGQSSGWVDFRSCVARGACGNALRFRSFRGGTGQTPVRNIAACRGAAAGALARLWCPHRGCAGMSMLPRHAGRRQCGDTGHLNRARWPRPCLA